MSRINRFSRASYRVSRRSRDLNALSRAIRTGSFRPLWVRLGNKLLGRLFSRMWFR